jgi:hypothetical protein
MFSLHVGDARCKHIVLGGTRSFYEFCATHSKDPDGSRVTVLLGSEEKLNPTLKEKVNTTCIPWLSLVSGN